MLVLASSERMKMADEDQNDVATVTQKNEKRPKMWQSMTLACLELVVNQKRIEFVMAN